MSSLRWYGVIGAATASLASPTEAQTAPRMGVEAGTEENRRGLSWSDGRASAAADIIVAVGRVEGTARVAALRGSARHGGADAVADLSLGSNWNIADFVVDLRATGHLFAGGHGDLSYGEVATSIAYSYGPVHIDAGASYAPHQDAIGGSNLYLYAGANAGIPTTPFTIVATVGRSSGDGDGSTNAHRLRPAGTYWDWRIGIERVRGPLSLGLDYAGTDIADRREFGIADTRDDGDRLVARARLSF
jgi:hypothetical protein